MKKIFSFTMAAITAISCCTASYAANTPELPIEADDCGTSYEEQKTTALEEALRKVKTRISIPQEYTEFDYTNSTNNTKDVYTFNWYTPYYNGDFREISCSICSSVITSYSSYDYSQKDDTALLSKLNEEELYNAALSAVKKLNPTVYKYIDVERDSLRISLTGNRAIFNLVRTKNKIPVDNDRGNIVLDKNTGELISFNIRWHTNASFKNPSSVISEEKAKEAYAEMIDIYPFYNISYDREKDDYITEIIYTQNNYGEINAFTGKKSDFAEDGYYDETSEFTEDSAVENPETGGMDKNEIFTEQELAEINKELPYGTEKAVRELLESKEYFTINDDMNLYSSNLYKNTEGKNNKYYYSLYFTSVDYDIDNYWNTSYEETNITVNAETGEIINYYYYKNKDNGPSRNFDVEATEKQAIKIAKELAGDKFDEYGEISTDINYYRPPNSTITNYYGSNHSFNRYVNNILVSSDNIYINFNHDNVLTSYSINYTEADFISPENMLTKDEIIDIYWENTDIDLYYLAKVHDKKTKTVLVYGTDSSVYCDAFTGDQKYYYYNHDQNDLSGITTKSIKEKAEILDNHGFIFSESTFKETDAVKESDFAQMLDMFTEMRTYRFEGELELADGRKFERTYNPLTNADAMIMLAAAECGTKVPQLEGIFRSPYTDVKDSDKNVGYYAIAYALTNSDSEKLQPDKAFTYADMVEMVYNYIA